MLVVVKSPKNVVFGVFSPTGEVHHWDQVFRLSRPTSVEIRCFVFLHVQLEEHTSLEVKITCFTPSWSETCDIRTTTDYWPLHANSSPLWWENMHITAPNGLRRYCGHTSGPVCTGLVVLREFKPGWPHLQFHQFRAFLNSDLPCRPRKELERRRREGLLMLRTLLLYYTFLLSPKNTKRLCVVLPRRALCKVL